MAKYQVDFSEYVGVEVDFPPGLPVPRSLDFDFEARTEVELRDLLRLLGFEPGRMDPTKSLHVRYQVPITRDGGVVSSCTVHLWLGDELRSEAPVVPPIPVLERIVGEAGGRA